MVTTVYLVHALFILLLQTRRNGQLGIFHSCFGRFPSLMNGLNNAFVAGTTRARLVNAYRTMQQIGKCEHCMHYLFQIYNLHNLLLLYVCTHRNSS